MKLPIGMMQGRLLPPFEGRYQAFPAESWEKEFYGGQKLGLHCIEWIYEKPHEQDNPFYSDKGISQLQKVIRETGVQVKSICADYYMTERFIVDGAIQYSQIDHFCWLLQQAKKVNITYIVLPFVDSSSLKEEENLEPLYEVLTILLKAASEASIEIHLEMDLTPQVFATVFSQLNHPYLKMNYDIGNSASLGYNPEEEFKLLGSYLGSVHIKDRALHGKSVPYGTGNANFIICFKWFEKLDFNRWYILQGYRDANGPEEDTIRQQMQYVQRYF